MTAGCHILHHMLLAAELASFVLAASWMAEMLGDGVTAMHHSRELLFMAKSLRMPRLTNIANMCMSELFKRSGRIEKARSHLPSHRCLRPSCGLFDGFL
jgi:hypothetical protein